MNEQEEARIEMEELEELQQKMAKEEQEKAQAEAAKPQPQPAEPVTPEPQKPEPSQEPVASQPMQAERPVEGTATEWAAKKGLNSPEAIARSLQQMEQEFHKRNQQGHPGYKDLNGNPAPVPQVPPNWNPNPEPAPSYPPMQGVPGYGYPPMPMPNANGRAEITARLAKQYDMDPGDVEKLLPMIVDASNAIAGQRVSALDQRLSEMQRFNQRNNELFQLMQDPAFTDPRVQMEMHEVLKDGQVFQRERSPYVAAFRQAMENMARKQILQQGGAPNGASSNPAKPPVTAGGGNGSSSVGSRRTISPEEFEQWTDQEQDDYVFRGKVPTRR